MIEVKVEKKAILEKVFLVFAPRSSIGELQLQ